MPDSDPWAEFLRPNKSSKKSDLSHPSLDLTTPPHETEPSPKPWPDRDWDRMPGKFLDVDVIRSMKPDTLRRDVYSEEDRVEAWETVNKLHMWAREHNPGIPKKHGIYLFSAGMGEGKSHMMISIAMLAFAYRAIPVFSSESMGALFGWRLSLEEIYNFPDVVPPGSIVLVDEIAALADRYSGMANRGRVLSAGLTSFRKGGNLLLCGTAAEAQVAWQIRVACEAVIEPRRSTPLKTVLAGYSFTGNPKYRKVRMREHELPFPPFCYQTATAYIQPWAGKRVAEDYRSEKASLHVHNRRQSDLSKFLQRWKTAELCRLSPDLMNLSACLYDTYSRVPISDAHRIDAAAMRTEADRLLSGRGVGAGLPAFLTWAFSTDFFDRYADGWIGFGDLHGLRCHFDKGYKGMSINALKRELEPLVPPEARTARRVAVEALRMLLP